MTKKNRVFACCLALAYGPVSPQNRTLSAEAEVNVVEIMTPSNGTADMVGNETCQYLNVWTDRTM